MGELVRDLRFAARMLAKNRTFTLAALVCLSLGIGANTAIFSVVRSVLLRPLPYDGADRLVTFEDLAERGYRHSFSPAEYLDLREWSHSFAGLAGQRGLSLNLTGSGAPERIRVENVSPGFFRVFGVEPALGRFFLLDDDSGAEDSRAVVLSHGAWQTRFGGAASAIGTVLVLNGQAHTIVGVAPATFNYPRDAELWVRAYRDGLPEPPVDLGDDLASVRNLGYFQVVGRLAHGVSFEAARAEMRVIAQRLAEARGDVDGANRFVLVRLHDHVVGEVRPALLVLLGAVGFVLLIACANVANLLLARATVRQREVAVRVALGAGRRRLIRQLMTESLLLGMTGGAVGLLLALWGVDVLVRLAPSDIPRLAEVGVDGWVLVFVAAVSVATSVAFGALPALQGSSPNLRASLNENGRRATEGRRRRRLSAGLVVSEIALSLVLVCGAALLTKSLVRLQHVNLGFRPDGLLVMRLALPGTRYTEEAQMEAFVREVTERVQVLPSVRSCGVALAHPFSGMAATLTFTIPGRVTEPGEETSADYQVVTPGYFETMGIPLMMGRGFGEADNADGPPVVVINEALAGWQWPGEDPIGKQLAVGGGVSSEIVGVVGDVRHFSHDREPRPEIYAPYYQDPWPFMALLVRAEGDPRNLIGPIRQQVLAVDSEQPVYAVNTMDRVLAESLQTRRFLARLVFLFAAVAIVLALVGIYGVISYTVNQRAHEIGIRMALGAQREEVLRYVLSWGLSLVLGGAVAGLLLALAVGRSISGLLYGVGPADPPVFGGVTLLLIVAAAAATYLPARRASRVDPLVALRRE